MKNQDLTFKVAEKSGGVSVYGLQRFPVTLYRQQWIDLMAVKDELLQFLEQHKGELKIKP
jgi:hypothetical protein